MAFAEQGVVLTFAQASALASREGGCKLFTDVSVVFKRELDSDLEPPQRFRKHLTDSAVKQDLEVKG